MGDDLELQSKAKQLSGIATKPNKGGKERMKPALKTVLSSLDYFMGEGNRCDAPIS